MAVLGALGVMVVTGVGNLGALGGPGPGTHWGRVFAVKLVVVLGVVVGSFVRTMAVVKLRERGQAATALLRRTYGATAALLLFVVVLAEVLAHG
ncbi:hypothetical protein VB779_14625 [Haloarculaceae archaeon H-GB11]|nr:hypothetical protein [Haloarculaceae archaeon H-GB11]